MTLTSGYLPTPPATANAAPPPPAEAPRWVWEAMDPVDRRAQMKHMADWVAWMLSRQVHPPLVLTDRIPACWYVHPGPLDRLTCIYVEWLRVHHPDSELPLASFYDLLDRHAATLGYPGLCLRGEHDNVRGADPIEEFDVWVVTSPWATAPATCPPFWPTSRSPEMTSAPPIPRSGRPAMVLPAAEITTLIATGQAERLGRTPAVKYDQSWWLGDEEAYIRVLDADMSNDLDRRAAKLAAGLAAVARAEQSAAQASEVNRPLR
ncbi:hypothetical protein [Sphaerisporangium album]|uniref:hypothetical protein n=1 Tax=Sphaerisporangium album TaxID=509200 RepID=UPI0015F0C8BA|nr:hypothetical protein [Sphaerisporangium album]